MSGIRKDRKQLKAFKENLRLSHTKSNMRLIKTYAEKLSNKYSYFTSEFINYNILSILINDISRITFLMFINREF